MSEATPAVVPQDGPVAPTPADMPDRKPADEPKREYTKEETDEFLKKLRSENHDLRAKLRRTEPLVKAAEEAEEARKTDIQKANDRVAKAEQALIEKEAGFTRLELAVQYSIPPDDIDLIGSGTREEMDARAKRLAALHAASTKASPPPTDRPVEGLRPGATPEPPKPADDSYPAAWTPSYLRDKESRSFYGQ